jgi:hypothetical protein
MSYLYLIHWNATEAEERATRLRALGYEVRCELPRGRAFFRDMAQDPPLAVIIDLTRLPSQGRDFGVNLRLQAATRRIPLVYVGGGETPVAAIRQLLPDAAYTTWEAIAADLPDALAHPPANPRVPTSAFEAYAGVPLPKKLGLKPDMALGLLNAPPDFAATLGELPPGVTLRPGTVEGCALVIWFVTRQEELERGIASIASRLGGAALWIATPKAAARAGGIAADLTQNDVRRIGLAAGLVDYKVCSIDATWSGLLFTVRSHP